MNEKFFDLVILLLVFILAACNSSAETAVPATLEAASPTITAATETAVLAPTEFAVSSPTANAPHALPTPAVPSGTVIESNASSLKLLHPVYQWQLELPADWVITYDAGFALLANSPDQTIFLRLQAQLWPQTEARLPDAQAYVDHWQQFIYGDVFPLYADGLQISESEMSQDKFGGPYLSYEFHDSTQAIHYLQLYASAGGPSSTMISAWAADDEYDNAQSVMQAILNSFELLEVSE